MGATGAGSTTRTVHSTMVQAVQAGQVDQGLRSALPKVLVVPVVLVALVLVPEVRYLASK